MSKNWNVRANVRRVRHFNFNNFILSDLIIAFSDLWSIKHFHWLYISFPVNKRYNIHLIHHIWYITCANYVIWATVCNNTITVNGQYAATNDINIIIIYDTTIIFPFVAYLLQCQSPPKFPWMLCNNLYTYVSINLRCNVLMMCDYDEIVPLKDTTINYWYECHNNTSNLICNDTVDTIRNKHLHKN